MFNSDDNFLFVQEKIHELVHPITPFSNRWNFRCPICGDSKKSRRKSRGNYYLKTNSYHCFNCEANAEGLWIIAKFTGKSIEEIKKEYFQYLTKYKNKREIIPSKPKIEPTIDKQKPKIKNTWIELTPDLIQYIEKRKILSAPNSPKNWKFYYETENKRLVIPWMRNNEMTYWQERAIFSWQTPKYKFPAGINKEIFGLDNIDREFPYLFLLEGAFDSVWVKNGLAIGGTALTEYQNEILSNFVGFCVVYMFDNQRIDESGFNKSLKLAKECPSLSIFVWPKEIKDKDVNEYVINHKENPFFDEIFLKRNIFKGISAMMALKNV